MKNVVYICLKLLLLILLSSCANNNTPSDQQVPKELQMKLPHNLKVENFTIEQSENLGSEVEPLIKSRFSGKVLVTEPMYQVKNHILGNPVLKVVVSEGTEVNIFGISASKYERGSWQIRFEKLESSPKVPGRPISAWEAGKYVLADSDQERDLIAKNEKLTKEKQDKIENNVSRIAGKWKGAYICGQGKMGLTLDVSSVANTLSVTFKFYPINDDNNAEKGSFILSGNIDDKGSFKLSPQSWIDRPQGYFMIPMQGHIDSAGKKLMGSINAKGCSTFEVKRIQAKNTPAA